MSTNMRRLLTGIRPTGALHLGHYVGALKQWIPLQKTHECFFLIADVQALTTHADRPELIEDSVRQVLLDFLAVGLNPKLPNVHFVLQSGVPELTELTLYLSMVTPFTWMEHNPTIKAEMKNLGNDVSTGFMFYPVSQAADILFVSPDPKATDYDESILVPVGQDQVPHLIDTKNIARRFNNMYGEVFFPCRELVGKIGRLVGTDGQAKMSKSMNNAIFIGDPSDVVRKKVMSMFTDPKRIRADIPGRVRNNPVFVYHNAFNRNKAEVRDLKDRYRRGAVGDVEVKTKLFNALEEFLTPFRARRLAAEEENLHDILMEGTTYARTIAAETLARVKSAMHLDYPGRFLR